MDARFQETVPASTTMDAVRIQMVLLFAQAAITLATVQIPGLTESSGLAASRQNPGIFWTINDDSDPILYAFDRTGSLRGRVEVKNAKALDWEGLAVGPGPAPGKSYLYVGDIGDNLSRRKFITVYRVEEPGLDAKTTEAADALRVTYPDGPHDAEALLVHPSSGDLYIVSKTQGKTGVYKATGPLKPSRLRHVADVNLPDASFLTMLTGRVTGGDISPDGRRVVLCDYVRGFQASVPAGKSFDAVWTSGWRPIDLGKRAQGEAVAYRHDGQAVLASSEGAAFSLIEVNVSLPTTVR